MRPQQMLCNSRVAITNTGQRNHPPNCTAICVLLAARERAQCINAPDVMWACAWCLASRNITPLWIRKLNDFELVTVASVITDITFAFTFPHALNFCYKVFIF